MFEERDVNISEAVDVPKALGDIFESLIGAIYLDSGKDLNVTWNVLYNLMKTEIGKIFNFKLNMFFYLVCALLINLALLGTLMVSSDVMGMSITDMFSLSGRVIISGSPLNYNVKYTLQASNTQHRGFIGSLII